MSLPILHLWGEPNPKEPSFQVLPPFEGGGGWQMWINRIPASERTFIPCHGGSYGGFWSISSKHMYSLSRRSIEMGWIVQWTKSMPPHIQLTSDANVPPPMHQGHSIDEDCHNLFVLTTAPKSVVKAAYNALVLEFHPDRHMDKSKEEQLAAQEKMKLLTASKQRIFEKNGW